MWERNVEAQDRAQKQSVLGCAMRTNGVFRIASFDAWLVHSLPLSTVGLHTRMQQLQLEAHSLYSDGRESWETWCQLVRFHVLQHDS